MQKNLIYLSKNKLKGIDGVLPILMEVKSRYREVNVLIVFSNDSQHDLIMRNYNMREVIQSIDAETYILKGRHKLSTLMRLTRFLSRLVFKKNIIVKDGDLLLFHNLIMKILRKFSETKEIKAYLIVSSIAGLRNISIEHELSCQKRNKPGKLDFFRGDYDYYLSTVNTEQFKEYFNEDAPKDKMVTVGYIRRLPRWQQYLSEAVRRNKVINEGDYFLYILTCLGRRTRHFDEPEMIELMEESLSVLKKYNNRIKTVFRPHATTDIKEVERLLTNIGYSNYVIDYGHPMVLSYNAKFIFGNIFSAAMFDGYYLGKPTVEYFQYDPELFLNMKNQSWAGSCSDFLICRDKEKLDEVLSKLINGGVYTVRDPAFIEANFPDTHPEFYEFWHRLIS